MRLRLVGSHFFPLAGKHACKACHPVSTHSPAAVLLAGHARPELYFDSIFPSAPARRYLMLEFPSLGVADPPQHIAEIGCGCGSGGGAGAAWRKRGVPCSALAAAGRARLLLLPPTKPSCGPDVPPCLPWPVTCAALLPVLKANPTCRVTGCDISPTALRLLGRAAEQAGVDPSRIRTFVLDAASNGSGGSSSSMDVGGPGGSPLAGLHADSCLLVFTLSALAPQDQPAVLAHAYAALRPGGLLLFRWGLGA